LLRRLLARFAVNELVAVGDQERVAETEEADRGGDLSHMSGIELTEFSGGGPQLVERKVGKLQAREHVVASSLRSKREGHPLLAVASAAALPLSWSPRVTRDAIELKRFVIGVLLLASNKKTK
jgi:hypothetical protein